MRLDDKADAAALEHGRHDGRVDWRRQGLHEAQPSRLEEPEVMDLGRDRRRRSQHERSRPVFVLIGRRTLLTWLRDRGRECPRISRDDELLNSGARSHLNLSTSPWVNMRSIGLVSPRGLERRG